MLWILPPAAILALVLTLGVDVPWRDQWHLVDPITQWLDGHRELSLLWRNHNEHRLLLPRAVMTGLAWLTGWNTRAEMLAHFAFGLLAFAGVWRCLVAALPDPAAGVPRRCALPAVAALMFSLHAWENWLWGFQLQISLCLAALVWGCVALGTATPGRPRLLIGVLLALVASYSFSLGFLAWPAGLLLLALRPPPRRRPLVAWVSVGAAAIGLHLLTLDRTGFPEQSGGSLGDLGGRLHFAVVFLGHGLLGPVSVPIATLAGALGLAAIGIGALLLARPGPRRRERLPLLGLGAVAVLAAMATAWGRAGGGPEWLADASRYTTISGLAWVVLVLLLATWWATSGRQWIRRLAATLILAVVSLSIASEAASWPAARAFHAETSALRAALLRGEGLSQRVLSDVPGRGALAMWLDRLEERRLSLFRNAARSPATKTAPILGWAIHREQGILTVELGGGVPGNAMRLSLVAVDGAPQEMLLFDGDFDQRGGITWRHPIPPDASWRSLTLRCIHLDRRAAVRSEDHVWSG